MLAPGFFPAVPPSASATGVLTCDAGGGVGGVCPGPAPLAASLLHPIVPASVDVSKPVAARRAGEGDHPFAHVFSQTGTNGGEARREWVLCAAYAFEFTSSNRYIPSIKIFILQLQEIGLLTPFGPWRFRLVLSSEQESNWPEVKEFAQWVRNIEGCTVMSVAQMEKPWVMACVRYLVHDDPTVERYIAVDAHYLWTGEICKVIDDWVKSNSAHLLMKCSTALTPGRRFGGGLVGGVPDLSHLRTSMWKALKGVFPDFPAYRSRNVGSNMLQYENRGLDEEFLTKVMLPILDCKQRMFLITTLPVKDRTRIPNFAPETRGRLLKEKEKNVSNRDRTGPARRCSAAAAFVPVCSVVTEEVSAPAAPPLSPAHLQPSTAVNMV